MKVGIMKFRYYQIANYWIKNNQSTKGVSTVHKADKVCHQASSKMSFVLLVEVIGANHDAAAMKQTGFLDFNLWCLNCPFHSHHLLLSSTSVWLCCYFVSTNTPKKCLLLLKWVEMIKVNGTKTLTSLYWLPAKIGH